MLTRENIAKCLIKFLGIIKLYHQLDRHVQAAGNRELEWVVIRMMIEEIEVVHLLYNNGCGLMINF